jgi:hypothetical protein
VAVPTGDTAAAAVAAAAAAAPADLDDEANLECDGNQAEAVVADNASRAGSAGVGSLWIDELSLLACMSEVAALATPWSTTSWWESKVRSTMPSSSSSSSSLSSTIATAADFPILLLLPPLQVRLRDLKANESSVRVRFFFGQPSAVSEAVDAATARPWLPPVSALCAAPSSAVRPDQLSLVALASWHTVLVGLKLVSVLTPVLTPVLVVAVA